jgi:predicted nucleic acid-binding protein
METLALRYFPPVICPHVAAEFLYGQTLAKVSASAAMHAREFLESFDILQPSIRTSAIYARIRADMKDRGISLPGPDYWIASHAIEEGLPLATTDRHFELIPELYLHFLKP